jgi:purine-nucleoside phosphorylase
VRALEHVHLPSDAASTAAQWIRDECRKAQCAPIQPKIGIILGSGLNDLLQYARIIKTFSYKDIPYFAPTTVNGHAGRFELGYVQDQAIAVLRGRFHFYEGHSPDRLVLPVRMLHALGVDTLIVTNAAGGLNPNFRKGDLMIMRDHIGLPTLAGYNPLVGPNDDDLGPRFPPMASAYDNDLIDHVLHIASETDVKMHEGVYVMVSGPTYETPAEMRALYRLGADAVGMSTVPEVIAARHIGMRVLGISCITNSATPETANTVCHEEVLEGAAATTPKLDCVLKELLTTFSYSPKTNIPHITPSPKPVFADVADDDIHTMVPDSIEVARARRSANPSSRKVTNKL